MTWPEDHTLVDFGGEPWRTKDACEGVLIFGGSGSGKTSGSGRTLARSYLSAGFGGLVLCAKTDEPDLWRRYAAETGRERDLIFFGRDPAWKFNFMNYEASRPGAGAGLTENLVNLFTEVASLGSAGGAPGGQGGGDPFWERAMKSLARNCIDLLTLAGLDVTLHRLFDVIRSSPSDAAEAASESWREKSACWAWLQEARLRCGDGPAGLDFPDVEAYWLKYFPMLGDRVRGSIVATFSTLAEGLTRGRMRSLFCEATTVVPEDVLGGRIVVVELPIKEWSEVGRSAAVIWKYCLQKAIERRLDRDGGGGGRPVFLWADECQYFASRYDSLFQATARSSRAASVYLTQNYPTLLAALGGAAGSRSAVDSLLGNLGTKIFHANSDRDTNQLAADLVGKCLHERRTSGAGSSFSFGRHGSFGTSSQQGRSEQRDYEIQPQEFSLMRRGGPENDGLVDALVFQSGRIWRRNGRPWIKAAFRQGTQAVPPPLPTAAVAPAFLPAPTLSTPSLPAQALPPPALPPPALPAPASTPAPAPLLTRPAPALPLPSIPLKAGSPHRHRGPG